MNVQAAAAKLTNEMEDHWSYKRDGNGATVEHAFWMLIGIAEGYVEHEKAHRWLGYAQAILVRDGLYTLSQMKHINKEAQ